MILYWCLIAIHIEAVKTCGNVQLRTIHSFVFLLHHNLIEGQIYYFWVSVPDSDTRGEQSTKLARRLVQGESGKERLFSDPKIKSCNFFAKPCVGLGIEGLWLRIRKRKKTQSLIEV